MAPTWVADYLARIGVVRPARPDAGTLRDLQHRHLLAVPFENLSIHLGEPIVLRDEALVGKVVDRHRGGFCYELNGAFAALLTALGYRVTLLAARAVTVDGLGPPFDHLALRVDLAHPWLVDVGFGSFSTYPLRLDQRADQSDPAGDFRMVEREHGDLEVLLGGEGQYRLEARPRALSDFTATCWWHQTSAESHFTRGPVCSRMTETGRVTLNGRRLIETRDGDRHERVLAGDGEVLDAYRTQFGIVLDRPPGPPWAAATDPAE